MQFIKARMEAKVVKKPETEPEVARPKAEIPVQFAGVGDDLDDFLVLSDEPEEVGRDQRERVRPSLVTGVPGEEPPFAAGQSVDEDDDDPVELDPGAGSAPPWSHRSPKDYSVMI